MSHPPAQAGPPDVPRMPLFAFSSPSHKSEFGLEEDVIPKAAFPSRFLKTGDAARRLWLVAWLLLKGKVPVSQRTFWIKLDG